MSVTVVIPTKDRPLYLRRAVASGTGQQGVDVEVIVVDDGSQAPATPGTGVELIRHTSPEGVAEARNHGLREAQGEWVAFLDDDDIWAPHHLRALLAQVVHGSALAFARHVLVDGGPQVLGIGADPSPATLQRDLLGRNVIVTPSAVIMRREALLEAGGFASDLSILADWDLWLRMSELGSAAASRRMTVGYTQHRSSMHRNIRGMLDEHARMQQLHAGLLQRHGTGLGDEIFWHWLCAVGESRRQRRLASRLYLRSQRGLAPAGAIAGGLSRLSVRRPLRATWSLPPMKRLPPGLEWLMAFEEMPVEGGSARTPLPAASRR